MFGILLCLTFFLILQFFIRRYRYWPERNVEHYIGVPVFGINWELLFGKTSVVQVLKKICDKYPDARYIGTYEYFKPCLIIKDPELLTKMCTTDFEHFTDHLETLPNTTDHLWNKSLFSLHGNKWREMRYILSPTYTGSRMKTMFSSMQHFAGNIVEDLMQQNEDIIEFDANDTFSRYVCDVIARTAFGLEYDSVKEKYNEFYVKAVQQSDVSGLWINIMFTILRAFPSLGVILKGKVFNRTISEFFRSIVTENIEFRSKNNTNRTNFINLLIQAKMKNESSAGLGKIEESTSEDSSKHPRNQSDLSVDDITAQALFFFVAGFGTTTSLCSFLCYELAVNPMVQSRLINEIDNFRSENQTISYENIGTLPYFDMVLSEALRKWPAPLRTDRKCSKSYIIQPKNPNEKPLHISEGQGYWIPLCSIHFDTKYWPNPEKFDPERFSPENKRNIVPGSYIPFGIGPRRCIGSRFAIQQIKIIFYELLSNFEIVPTSKTIIPCQVAKSSTIIVPGEGFLFGLKRRKPFMEKN